MSEQRSRVATFYVRLRAEFNYAGEVARVKAVDLRQNPCGHESDETVVGVRLRVPAALFDPPMTRELTVELADAEIEAEAVPS